MTGDPEAIRARIVSLLPQLRRFARALTHSAADADDLVQATCERALQRLAQWQPGTRLDSWLYRIAQNLWIDRVRRERRLVPFEETVHGPSAWDSRPESERTLESVSRAMRSLPREQQLVLALVCVEGMSYQQAADVLEVPAGTVMSRLARARRRLHHLVYGCDADDGARGGIEE